MKKTIGLMAALLLMAGTAAAERIDKGEALKIASEFFGTAAGRKTAPAKGDATLRPAGEGRAYYAFNRGEGNGYVIVAADDRAAESVLGFADSGAFSSDSMPPAMRWWLDEYARQIDYAAGAERQTDSCRPRLSAPDRKDIAPLLTTLWDQNEPYNLLCPEYEGEKCLTGCLATAVAQVMRYHRWPERGTGSHSYEWEVDDKVIDTLSVDFSQSVYNWDAMTDTYGKESTEEQRNAVARLMYDVGVACDMQYHPQDSGALSTAAVVALQRYFGYSRSDNLLFREYYTIDEWEDTVYSSLAQGLPVLYSGVTSTSEGHAFVCDGYRDGYFHINWGWSGVSNGYFLLWSLDPDVQGTGGSSSGNGFDFYQDILTARPAEAGDVAVPQVLCGGSFGVDTTSVAIGDTVVFTGGFWNYSASKFHLTLGIKLVDGNGKATYVESFVSDSFDMYYGYPYFSMEASAFPAGNKAYAVYPACRDEANGRWYDIKVQPATGRGYLIAEVSGQGIEFSVPGPESSKLEAGSPELLTKAYAGSQFKVKARLTNSGAEYFDDVRVAVLEPGRMEPLLMSDPVMAALRQGESHEVEFTVTAPAGTGAYELVVVDTDNSIISGRTPVTVEEAPQGDLVLSLLSAPVVADSSNVSADDIRVTMQVECTSGYYNGLLYAFVYPEGAEVEEEYATYFTSPFFISKGDTVTAHFNGRMESAAVGEKYWLKIYYRGEDGHPTAIPSDNNKAHFTIGLPTSVESVESTTGPHDIEVYTPTGVCVLRQKAPRADLSALQPGLYIVKENGKSRKVVK